MAETRISWAKYTFNPVWGCSKVSEGCRHCFAEAVALQRSPGQGLWQRDGRRKLQGATYWNKPLAWNAAAEKAQRRERVFCGSMCDVFENHETLIVERRKLWPLIEATPWLDWLILTKRAVNLPSMAPVGGYPVNTWLGVSVENQDAVERIEMLTYMNVAVRFVSYEPAIGPIEIPESTLRGTDWWIYGGESGPQFRPDDVAWARTWRDRCKAAGIAYWYKQAAAYRPQDDHRLDGQVIQELPTPRVLPAGGRVKQPALFDTGTVDAQNR